MRFFDWKKPTPSSQVSSTSLNDGYAHSILDPGDSCHGRESGLLAGSQLSASGMIPYDGDAFERDGDDIPVRKLS